MEDNNAQINTLNPPWNPNDPDFINRPTVTLSIEGQPQVGGQRYRLKSKKSKIYKRKSNRNKSKKRKSKKRKSKKTKRRNK